MFGKKSSITLAADLKEVLRVADIAGPLGLEGQVEQEGGRSDSQSRSSTAIENKRKASPSEMPTSANKTFKADQVQSNVFSFDTQGVWVAVAYET